MSTLDALLHDDDGLDMPSVNNVSEGANGPEPSAADEATEGASGAGTSGRASSEWQAVIDSYIRPPSTPLETERQELLRSFEYHAPEDLTTEAELGALQRARTETELLARARLAVVYEQKEAARRVREWQRRGVAMDSLPAPALELTDNST